MTEDLFEMRRTFRLSDVLAQLLRLLLTETRVTQQMIEHDYRLSTDAKVAIHRLRRRLKPHNIRIETLRGDGYWLEPQMKQQIENRIRGDLAA